MISDDEIEELVTSSDDGFSCGRLDGKKHAWQGDSVPFNRVTTYSNIGEPGGHLHYGENFVDSLLTHKLSESARTEHIDMFLKNSH